MKILILSLIGIFDFYAWGSSPNVLNGDWIRVADGCHQLSGDMKQHLPESGGWNGMQRRMELVFEDGKFTSIAMRSLKCESDFQLKGPDLVSNRLYCDGIAINRGSTTFEGNDQVNLVATDFVYAQNTWGLKYRRWTYELADGVLSMRIPDKECDSGQYYVYFIPNPQS